MKPGRFKVTNPSDPHRRPLPERIVQFARRLPFTFLMLGILSAGAIITNTHVADLIEVWRSRLGFAPRDLWQFRWERLVTSALVTESAGAFRQAIAMIGLAVGISEWTSGTRRATLTFWGVHFVTLLTESLLVALPLHLLSTPGGTELVLARDVGPSAGYFGCLGLASARLPKPWKYLSGIVVIGGLLFAALSPAKDEQNAVLKLAADLAHIIAFPLGWFSSSLFTQGWSDANHTTR